MSVVIPLHSVYWWPLLSGTSVSSGNAFYVPGNSTVLYYACFMNSNQINEEDDDDDDDNDDDGNLSA